MTKDELKKAFEDWAEFLDAQDITLPPVNVGYLLAALISGSKLSEEAYNSFGYRLISQRIKARHNYTLDDNSKVVIDALCISPGEMVMYCNYLQWKSETMNDMKDITLEKLCISVFPFGFFTHKGLEKAWNKQKIEGDNLLDMLSFK